MAVNKYTQNKEGTGKQYDSDALAMTNSMIYKKNGAPKGHKGPEGVYRAAQVGRPPKRRTAA